jgi:hypothetical protein
MTVATADSGEWISIMPAGHYAAAVQRGARLHHLPLLELLQRYGNGNPAGITVGLERLSERLDVSEGTVTRWLRDLQAVFAALGFDVDRAPRARGGRGRFNRYTSPQCGADDPAVFVGPEVYESTAWMEGTNAQRGAYLFLRGRTQVPHVCGQCGKKWGRTDDQVDERCHGCGSTSRIRPPIDTSYHELARRWGYADWRHVKTLVRHWSESGFFRVQPRRSEAGGYLGIRVQLVDREQLVATPPPAPRARPIRAAITSLQQLGARIARGLGLDVVTWLAHATVDQIAALAGECRDRLGRAGRLTLRTALRARRVLLAEDRRGALERQRAAVVEDELAHEVRWAPEPATPATPADLEEAAAVARVRSQRLREAQAALDRLETLTSALRAAAPPPELSDAGAARAVFRTLVRQAELSVADQARLDWCRRGRVLVEAERQRDLLRWRMDEPDGVVDLVGDEVLGVCRRLEGMVADRR